MIEPDDSLPRGWSLTNIGELVDRLQYGFTAKASNDLLGPRFLRITDIEGETVDWNNVPGCSITEEEYARYRLEVDDIVFARTGSIEKAWRVSSEQEAVFASYLIRGRPIAREVSWWLSIFVRTRSYRRQIGAAGAGTGRQNVNASNLAKVELPLAPLSEQRRIVAKIESLQARSRRAREALAEVGPLLEQFRQSVLAATFRGDLTADWRAAHPDVEPASELLKRIRAERRRHWEQAELAKYKAKGKQPPKGWQDKYKEPEPVDESELPELPEGWCWAPAEEIVSPDADIRYGIVQPGPPRKQGVPYVRGVDIQADEIVVNQLWKTTQEIANEYRNSTLHEGDVLLGIIRHLKVAIVPKSLHGGNMARTTARLRPSPIVSSRYLADALRSPFCQKWLKANYRGGTSMPKVNIAEVCRLPIPVAPKNEQNILCQKLDAAMAPIATTVATVRDVTGDLELLNQSILAKAFRGELVSQDPYDEPASVLLERICAAREQPAPAKIGSAKRVRRNRAAKG